MPYFFVAQAQCLKGVALPCHCDLRLLTSLWLSWVTCSGTSSEVFVWGNPIFGDVFAFVLVDVLGGGFGECLWKVSCWDVF